MGMSIGACFHREQQAMAVIDQVRAAEAAGYDEFWVIEDCFFTAGASLAGAALASTNTIGVGIGIMPTVARNAAVTAMEIATLAGLAPGRFHAGLGHGVQAWMEQMNERRSSPLTMLEETISAVQRLLAGERVTEHGRYVSLTDVALEVLPPEKPLVSAGVRGPRSLDISGRVADGTILADFVNPTYVRWASEQIGRGAAGGQDHHRITAFATMAIDADGDAMRAALAPVLAEICTEGHPSLSMATFFDELSERAEATSWPEATAAMPAEWWHEIAAVGDPEDAARYIAGMEEAGVDALAFFPSPFDSAADITRSAPYLLGRR